MLLYSLHDLAHLHIGVQIYDKILKSHPTKPELHNYLACCYFMLGLYPEAMKEAEQGSS